MRTRQRVITDDWQTSTWPWWTRNNITGVTTNAPISLTTGQYSRQTITDTLSSRFYTLLKCGEFLPLNGVTISTETWQASAGFCETVSSNGNYSYYRSRVYGRPSPTDGSTAWWRKPIPPPDASKINSVQLTSAANAVGEQWDVLTMIAELGSTMQTFEQLARKFRRGLIRAAVDVRRRVKHPRDAWELFRKEWLFWRYGVRPIVYDMRSAEIAINRLLSEIEFVVGRGYLTDDDSQVTVTTGQPDFGNGTNHLVEVRTELRRVYRGWAAMKLDGAAGLQFDPLVTAWELLGYSFVIDHFVNIGGWLSTLDPVLRGNFKGRCYSIVTDWNVSQVDSNQEKTAPGSFRIVAQAPTSSSYTLREYVRVPVSGVPPFPGLNPRVNLPFAVDLLALFLGTRKDVGRILNRR